MENLPSNAQLDRLGDRLRLADDPPADDLRLLQLFRSAHAPALVVVEDALEDLGFSPTSRTKTPETIVDKLKRETTRLTSIQDIVGVRIVPDVMLDGQDAAVARVTARLGGKVYDRREKPTHGYRAVHVVVRVLERRVEVQVRTPLQHLWAEVMERIADRFGRGIRYGVLPLDATRRDVVQDVLGLSADIAEHEKLRTEVDRLQREIAAIEMPSNLSEHEVAALAAHRRLKAQLDADEISFRQALRVIRDALEGSGSA
ncbi:MAG: RelA/SpoT domain-containing protein [Actinomycetota bacterium]|nr:RelA/SpoT domain-containing protein [Actinomycetota bacterium]